MRETNKATVQRRLKDPNYTRRYFVGNGIDIGGGDDSLAQFLGHFPLMQSVRTWDVQDGDGQYLEGVADNSLDFVYSSHCLEHLHDPVVGLQNWLRVLKPRGFLVVSIPDEDLYEGGIWPSIKNLDHKFSFTLYKSQPTMPNSINVLGLSAHFADQVEIERIVQVRDFYREDLPPHIDQTLGNAECAIEFVWRKK
ncbi:MAG: methyltransferase domain-containing protein [Conchiformibius sp.]|nr:methyltransferase domain-containing protein [Conchiformibius sp.]